MRFEYDVGLPGKAWAAGYPMVLKDLEKSNFRRREAAQQEGISCIVALPIFARGKLSAVTLFMCGDDDHHVGAIELWTQPEGETSLGLVDGYFGSAETFEQASRQTRFTRGAGLPGQVWESGMPVVMEDLGRGNGFLRQASAELAGINRAVGFPCAVRDESLWIMTFLSALDTPIARRFECWVPDEGSLSFSAGYCEAAGGLAGHYEGIRLPLDSGHFGTAQASGVPMICADLSRESGPVADSATLVALRSMIALPIFAAGEFKAILAWFL